MNDRALALRLAVVAEARTWVTPRTPFHHQACKKGIGVDCIRLIQGVGEAVPAMDPVPARVIAQYTRFYGRRPNPEVMREFLDKFLIAIKPYEATIGDVAWTHWGNDFPIHMAIRTELDGIPHFIDAVWQHGVAEQRMTRVFTDRVTQWWRYPYIAIAEAE